MKRHFVLVEFSKDHHQALILAQICKINSPEYNGMPTTDAGKAELVLERWESELNPHFNLEEKVLIPLVENKSRRLKELCKRIILEHKQIGNLIGKISEDVELESTLNEFGLLLDNHVRLEEREWFEEIQNSLSNEEMNNLGTLVKKEKELSTQNCKK